MKHRKDKSIATYVGSEGILRVREIFSGKYEDFSETKFIQPHRRDFYLLFLVKTGFIRHSVDFRNYVCPSGTIFFIAPEEIFLVDSSEDFGGISINFKPELLTAAESTLPIIQNFYHQNLIRPDIALFKRLSDLMENMVIEYKQQHPFREKLLRAYFSTLLIHMSRAYQKQFQNTEVLKEEAGIVERFRSLIDRNWKSPERVTDYAKRLFVSPGHLNHVVKLNTGKKAIELIQEKKLVEAKRLLLYSPQSIKEIADQTGFEDPSYFNRFFKKWNSKTPLRFREEMLKKYHKK